MAASCGATTVAFGAHSGYPPQRTAGVRISVGIDSARRGAAETRQPLLGSPQKGSPTAIFMPGGRIDRGGRIEDNEHIEHTEGRIYCFIELSRWFQQDGHCTQMIGVRKSNK